MSSEEIWSVGRKDTPKGEGMSEREKWHLGLATAGLSSGLLEPLGMAADAADFFLYASEGDLEGMGYSAFRFLPVAGVAGYFGGYFSKAKEGTERYMKMVHKAAVHEQLLQTHKIIRSIENSGEVGPLIQQYIKLGKLPEWVNRADKGAKIPHKIYAGQIDPKNWRAGEKFIDNPVKHIEEQLLFIEKKITDIAPDYFNLRSKLHSNWDDVNDMVSKYIKDNPNAKRRMPDKRVLTVMDEMVEQGLSPAIGKGVLQEVDKVGARFRK